MENVSHTLAGFALAAALVALPVRYCLERWKPLQDFREERAVAADLRRMPSGQILVVGTQHPIETMFYADVVAMEGVPPEEQLAPLRAAGWRIMGGP